MGVFFLFFGSILGGQSYIFLSKPYLALSFFVFCFLACLLLQLLFWGIFLPRLPLLIDDLACANLPPLSLLVCGRNEAEALQRNLPLWLRQDYPAPWELLYVDDASQDESLQYLHTLKKDFPHLRILALSSKVHPGKGGALRLGLAACRYERVLLSDADCWPATPRSLWAMASGKGDVVLGFSPYAPLRGLLGLCVGCETLFTALQYGSAAAWNWSYMGVGRNLGYGPKALALLPPLDANLAGGDDDLSVNALSAKGLRIVAQRSAQALTYSPPPATWAAWFGQKQRHLSTATRYRLPHQLGLGALALSHTGLWASVLILAATGQWQACFYGLLALRSLLLARAWWRWSKALQQEKLKTFFWFFDFFVPFYHCIFAPSLFIKRRTNWK